MSTEAHWLARRASPSTPPRAHGVVRGDDSPGRSSLYEGRFGRMFRTLPPAEFSDRDLEKLAAAMVAPAERRPTPETETDDEENQGINAGYTYLAQFIDHDLTFDPMSSLQRENDPRALTDFRTPRFDLDSLYGRGPDDQPYLYEDDGLHLKLGRPLTGSDVDRRARDLPRHQGGRRSRARALIGDPRNDENVIVAQLHAVMLRFHNHVVDHLSRDGRRGSFAEAQRLVRWHYQWVVLHDFLPTIVGRDTVDSVLPHLSRGTSPYADKPDLRVFRWRHQPFMPVEFSAAAYRFGHSMVRPIYRLNTNVSRKLILTPRDSRRGLNGFRDFPSHWAIDWRLFFDLDSQAPPSGIRRIQKSYKIDTSLTNPLAHLPPSTATGIRSLAERNLRRGRSMGLPSGQDVARAMAIEPIPDERLRVGKATEKDTPSNPRLTSVSRAFAGNAPLWYYVLAEAQQQFERNDTPIRLGPVGGRIVAEVVSGLLLGDRYSFLSQAPGWTPELALPDLGQFGIADLIRLALRGDG